MERKAEKGGKGGSGEVKRKERERGGRRQEEKCTQGKVLREFCSYTTTFGFEGILQLHYSFGFEGILQL